MGVANVFLGQSIDIDEFFGLIYRDWWGLDQSIGIDETITFQLKFFYISAKVFILA